MSDYSSGGLSHAYLRYHAYYEVLVFKSVGLDRIRISQYLA